MVYNGNCYAHCFLIKIRLIYKEVINNRSYRYIYYTYFISSIGLWSKSPSRYIYSLWPRTSCFHIDILLKQLLKNNAKPDILEVWYQIPLCSWKLNRHCINLDYILSTFRKSQLFCAEVNYVTVDNNALVLPWKKYFSDYCVNIYLNIYFFHLS